MQPVGAGVPLRVDIAEKTFRSAQGVSITALQDLSFEVRQGEFACLLGPSGCGKTTTLRILLGLDKDFSGSFQLPEGGSNRIAAVFQEPTLLPWRTVEQNVRLALPKSLRNEKPRRLVRQSRPRRHALALSSRSFRSAWRAGQHLRGPSRPNRRCFSSTNPLCRSTNSTAERLRHLLLTVWSARPTTALMVTHNLREALMLSDRIIVLSPRPAHVLGVFDVRLPRQYRNPQAMSDLLRSFNEKFPGVT